MTAIDVITESEQLLKDAIKHECNGRHEECLYNLTCVMVKVAGILDEERISHARNQ